MAGATGGLTSTEPCDLVLAVPRELPLGPRISWTPVEAPRREPLRGSHVLLRPLDAALDAEPLFAVSHPPDGDPAIWTYLPDGLYESPEQMREVLASRRAAERFGFTFEGVFRNHQVVKGRNRDTAWFSITGEEWPAIRDEFEAWLAPGNFDADGLQKRSLRELIAAVT